MMEDRATHPSADSGEGGPKTCPENEEFFEAPDAESKEEAINKFF